MYFTDVPFALSQQDGGGEDLAGGGLGHGPALVHLAAPHGHPHRGHRVQLLEDRVRGAGREDPGVPGGCQQLNTGDRHETENRDLSYL